MKKYNTSYRLKQIMAERNLKQIDIINLAKPFCDLHNVKLNKNDLSQYVSGKVEPGQNKLYILALALNVNEAWLMGFDVSPDKKLADKKEINLALTDSEKVLISHYRLLNDSGKEKLLEYSEDLIGNAKYTTPDFSDIKEKHA